MKLRNPLCFLIAGALCLAAIGAAAQEKAARAPVRVFNTGELTLERYTVVKRLWVENWRSAFWLPRHADSGAAIAALTAEAENLGADAVTNLHCLIDRDALFAAGSVYFCYGLAIKLR